MTSRKTSTDTTDQVATDADRVARTLPDWDLLPGHSVLTRRRPNFVRTQPSAVANLPSSEPAVSGTQG